MPTGIYVRVKKLLGHPQTEKTRKKISKTLKGRPSPMKGIKLSKERIDKMREISLKNGNKPPINFGSKNNKWKGDKVSYSGLHHWVKGRLGKPDTCEHCGRSGLTGHQIQWANKSGKYRRKLSDWIRLCCKCHIKYDKSRKLINSNNNK